MYSNVLSFSLSFKKNSTLLFSSLTSIFKNINHIYFSKLTFIPLHYTYFFELACFYVLLLLLFISNIYGEGFPHVLGDLRPSVYI